jgi:hypothetical protein
MNKHRKLPLARQEGIIVVFTLLAVVLLLLASIALVRSFDTSLVLAGNMAFKRDLANQSERGNASAMTALTTGALAGTLAREADSKPDNYSATTLPSDAHGIPSILVDDAAWTASGMALTDLTDAASGTTVRYVIDRLCTSAGSSVAATNYCAISALGAPKSKGVGSKMPPPAAAKPVYRVSIRVTGPRNTQTFVQSVLTI